MTQPYPQQSYQPPMPPRPPKKKMNLWAKIGIWAGGAFVGFIVLGVIGELTGAGKTSNAASQTIVVTKTTGSRTSASAAPVKASATPAATSAKPTPAKPSPTHAATKAKPAVAASPTCDLTKEPDVIVWEQWPGLPDAAEELGGWNPSDCKSSIDSIMSTEPTGAGYCTKIAMASDNPGYNVDARPAKPLKKVIEQVGAGC